MERVLEAELMDDPVQAAAYAGADFAEVNAAFVDTLRQRCGDLRNARVLDLGCGPADIPIRLAGREPSAAVYAVDGSRAMLELAAAAIRHANAGPRVALVLARLPALPFAATSFDAIVSNSLAHHLADPRPFWSEVVRLGRPGAAVFVTDLARPKSPEEARAIVDRYAAGEPAILRRDFYNSLRAAFTLEEIAEQIRGLPSELRVERASDRHWTVSGRLQS